MKEQIMNNVEVNRFGLYDHLVECRCAAAKVYPVNGKYDRNFLERVQGYKLTKGEMKALKRG